MAGSILSLDQSLSATGWALLDPVAGGEVQSGTWALCECSADRALGFRELWRRLDETHKAHGLGLITHEEPALGAVNKGADQIIGAVGLIAIIELFACSRGIAPRGYAARSWRSTFFTKVERQLLKGKSWKHPAVLRARQFGFDPVTPDEAEAIGILDHHLLKSKITPPWRQGATAMLDSVA